MFSLTSIGEGGNSSSSTWFSVGEECSGEERDVLEVSGFNGSAITGKLLLSTFSSTYIYVSLGYLMKRFRLKVSYCFNFWMSLYDGDFSMWVPEFLQMVGVFLVAFFPVFTQRALLLVWWICITFLSFWINGRILFVLSLHLQCFVLHFFRCHFRVTRKIDV